MADSAKNAAKWRARLTLLFAVIILVPSMIGFSGKLLEFIHTYRTRPDGAFAITPLLNYVLASLGFLCLLLWATVNGMFHDLERPKQLMLDREMTLDHWEDD